jgi:hypothetical protein
LGSVADDLIHAFPEPLWPEAEAPVRLLLRRIEAPRFLPGEKERFFLSVTVEGGLVAIPYRIYDDEAFPRLAPERLFDAFAELLNGRDLSARQTSMFFCLLSRHHNGIVREAALCRITAAHEAFTAPFITQLAAEYVYEILMQIRLRIAEFDPHLFGAFFRANPDFLAVSRQRMISYWSCYYRRRDYTGADGELCHHKHDRYIGFDIFEAFAAMARQDGATERP